MADIQSLFSQANQAQQNVVSGMEASTKLPEMLRQAVADRFKDTGMVEARSGAAGNLLTSDANKRSQLTEMGQSGQAILSPSQQQSILASNRAAALTPLMSLNDFLNFRTGTTEQAIQAGIQNNATNLQAQQLGASNLYQQAQDAWQRDLSERQFALSQANSANDNKSIFELMRDYGIIADDTGGQTTQQNTFNWDDFGLGDNEISSSANINQEVVSTPSPGIWDRIKALFNRQPTGGSW